MIIIRHNVEEAHHFFKIYAPPKYIAFYITGIDISQILFKSLFRCHSHIKFIRTHSHEKLTLIRTYVAEIWKETNVVSVAVQRYLFANFQNWKIQIDPD